MAPSGSLSRARVPAQVAIPMAARALGVGIAANTLLKLVVALSVGRGTFRALAGIGLGALLAFLVAALVLF